MLKEVLMAHPGKFAPRPAVFEAAKPLDRLGPDLRQDWNLSHYRLAAGSVGSAIQPVPFPELIAVHLEPGESLTICFDLQPSRVSDFTASITLKTRNLARNHARTTPDDSGAAKLASLSICIPGYRLEEIEETRVMSLATVVPGHSSLSLSQAHDWAVDTEAACLGCGLQRNPLVHLPIIVPSEIRVDQLLKALIDAGQAASLSVELARVTIGRREVLLIERTQEALRARGMSLPAEGSEAALVRFQLAQLQGWAGARSGVSLAFGLGFEDPAPQQLLKIVADLLFGPRPAVRIAAVDNRSPDLDLSLSIASMMKAPVLVPPAQFMDQLGFFTRRRWKGRIEESVAACQIGCTLGGVPVSLAPTDLGRHLYIIGATGVGKSTLMAKMIRQDIDNGLSTIVIDPHGDLFKEIRDGLSDDQRQRACVADLSVVEGGFGLDLLDMSGNRPDIRLNFVCNQLIAVFRKVLYRDQPEGFGPMFESYFRNALMLLVLGNEAPCSLSDFDRVFSDPKYRAELLANCKDEMVVRFWKQTAVRAGGEAALENIAPYIVSKLTQFTGSPLIRPIIDGTRPTVNLGHIFDKNGVLIVNLAKGVVGEADAALVGALFSIDLFAAALARTSVPRQKRTRVRLYMDEFQNYASDVLAQMLAECRKFGLELVLANQSMTQISGARSKPDVADAILANVGTVLAFRTGPRDARLLEEWFAPSLDAAALMRLADHSFAARLLQDGVPIEPFVMRSHGMTNSLQMHH